MTAQDFGVTFDYGRTSPPYSANSPHRGQDRDCPYGTSLVAGGTQIGLTGNTGYVLPKPSPNNPYAGSHLHVQEWHTYPSNTRKPQNSFKGGVVVHTSFSSDFGNYVTIQKDGWNTSYCHLSRIDVKVGQIIGETTMTPDALNLLAQAAWNTPVTGDDKFVKDYTGKSPESTIGDVLRSSANVELRTKAANYDNVRGALNSAYEEIEKLRKEMPEAQAKLNAILSILKEK